MNERVYTKTANAGTIDKVVEAIAKYEGKAKGYAWKHFGRKGTQMGQTFSQQFRWTGDTTVWVRAKRGISGFKREYLATLGDTGWSAKPMEPQSTPREQAIADIPEHHKSLIKWASEQKNLDLLDVAKIRENQREKPRQSVLAAIDEALNRY